MTLFIGGDAGYDKVRLTHSRHSNISVCCKVRSVRSMKLPGAERRQIYSNASVPKVGIHKKDLLCQISSGFAMQRNTRCSTLVVSEHATFTVHGTARVQTKSAAEAVRAPDGVDSAVGNRARIGAPARGRICCWVTSSSSAPRESTLVAIGQSVTSLPHNTSTSPISPIQSSGAGDTYAYAHRLAIFLHTSSS